MENKQTAVEWLEENLIGNPYFECEFTHNRNVFKQAKKMERNQIEKSYSDGFDDGYLLANGEDTKFDDCYLYYHETYEK